MFDLIRSTRSIFDDFFDDFPKMNRNRIMDTDIIERSNSYVFEVDLPGFKKEDIKVSIDNNYLIIEATKTTEKNEEKYIRREREYGVYRRSYYVGNIDINKINAKYDHGILIVEIPKEVKDDTKYIEVK